MSDKAISNIDDTRRRSDVEKQLTEAVLAIETLPIIKNKSLGAGVCDFLKTT